VYSVACFRSITYFFTSPLLKSKLRYRDSPGATARSNVFSPNLSADPKASVARNAADKAAAIDLKLVVTKYSVPIPGKLLQQTPAGLR
jgi:hypothetical protein